ncbi:thioesterase domain-containing protein [Aquimonas voraii]|uniref:Alpha/beta hydrolase family protein n=1 Tax=Aquimonas voraii TaxID=265719 RepID=A0A1G7AKI3_9GAMM|nr:thioesterase domain-containing protein [Aquimonas voraii]SDE14977.1 Alpha/beta hydrolase family protein [Aquimonas voraii]
METPVPSLSPPATSARWAELRAAPDLLAMAAHLAIGGVRRASNPRRVVVLPGFGADDRVMWPLRKQLARAGHEVQPWGLGRNLAGLDIRHRFEDLPAEWVGPAPAGRYAREAGVTLLAWRMTERLRSLWSPGEAPFRLVGWSLGGLIAREVARELPEAVAQVITLGTPVIGGPKYTVAGAKLRARGVDIDWIEREVERRQQIPIRVPITAIVSRRDGIVAPQAARDRVSPQVRHVEVDTPHLSLAFKPSIWALVLEALERGN